MLTWEIERELAATNNWVTPEQIIGIISTSPQIDGLLALGQEWDGVHYIMHLADREPMDIWVRGQYRNWTTGSASCTYKGGIINEEFGNEVQTKEI